ncbi:hypothetical protein GCM10011506_37180 [Marivirga lumbricoides]|uniref:Uncharacterized protein n=1 Tax=Marivirga lumbricoides TaxID=1046115 RepID=A0ABQ1MZI2_9BACT|nr:hypothetical protein GCM10011506_37180 [Marivirga lumbricoides]
MSELGKSAINYSPKVRANNNKEINLLPIRFHYKITEIKNYHVNLFY